MDLESIPQFTADDFLFGCEPYQFAYDHKDDAFVLEQVLGVLSKMASSVGCRNFIKRFKQFELERRKSQRVLMADNVTEFEGQALELNSGQWKADECGISIDGAYGESLYACNHPILPTLRLVNVDTGVEKLQIEYRKGRQWRKVIADKKTLASNNSILDLANVGVGVTCENAKLLVRYLHDVESLNYEFIPEKNSVGRLGWIDGEGFSPYVENLIFDGDANFKTFFESVQNHGSADIWLDFVKEIRTSKNVTARIILAASFASALVKPLGGLPFFVHLWGGTEVGKTVGLMLAASVWANPEVGRFIHTFNSTAVGREKSAAFVNSLPLILDELQIVKEKKEFDKDIYMLSEGAGRTRGNKSGGVDKTPTWANCILTSGEMPITGAGSGGGAVNRIIEVECKERLFDDPRKVANTLKNNYGFAGEFFIYKLQRPEGMTKVRKAFDDFYAALSKNDTTEKQAMAAALVLTADALTTEWIFKDGVELKVEDMAEFLKTKASVSAHERAYEYLCEYIAQNKNHFCGKSETIDVWGDIGNGYAYIVRREFDRICIDAGFNSTAFLSWMRQNGKIETRHKGFTNPKRINEQPCNCVFVKLPQFEPQEVGLIDEDDE